MYDIANLCSHELSMALLEALVQPIRGGWNRSMCVCINADIAIIFPLSFTYTTAVSRVLNLFQLVLMERSISSSFEPDAWVYLQ